MRALIIDSNGVRVEAGGVGLRYEKRIQVTRLSGVPVILLQSEEEWFDGLNFYPPNAFDKDATGGAR